MGKYFTIKELTKTSSKLDNTPTKEIVNHLEELITLLDKIREEWTVLSQEKGWGTGAIIVNSGYRSKAVNKAVGGSRTSEHMLGYAVDIEPKNQKNLEFFNFVKDYLLSNDIGFSQLINEKPINTVPSWVHLSINGRKGQRKEIKTL